MAKYLCTRSLPPFYPSTLPPPSRLPLAHRNHLTLPQHPPRDRLRPTPPRRVILEQHVPSACFLQRGLPAGRRVVLRLVRPDDGIDADDAVDRADHFGDLDVVFYGAGVGLGFGGVDEGLQARDALEVRGDGGEGWLAWVRGRGSVCCSRPFFKGRDRGQKWRVPLKPDVRKFVTWVANCSRYVAPSALPNDKSSQ